MNCPLSWEVLGAWVDREFEHCPASASLHVATCSSCQATCEDIRRQATIIRDSAVYFKASPRLRELITKATNRHPLID